MPFLSIATLLSLEYKVKRLLIPFKLLVLSTYLGLCLDVSKSLSLAALIVDWTEKLFLDIN